THLGDTIDIHGGGNDLKVPHHENEIAQSCSAHGGAPLARYWIHNGFVEMDSAKMSKSLGNVLLVRELLERHPGEALRLALLKAKYREPLHWSEDLVAQAKNQLDRIYGALERLEDVSMEESACVPDAAFTTAMDDDLNTPQALAALMETVSAANRADDAAERARLKAALLGAGRELGILTHSPAAWFRAGSEAVDTAAIETLVRQRESARAERDFARADEIRDRLAAMGVQIQDGADGTQWRLE
ncbi:MAG: DALR domain-containing protein, partial [Gammaproteobacteria bacterium]